MNPMLHNFHPSIILSTFLLVSLSLSLHSYCTIIELKHYDHVLGVPFVDILVGSPPVPQLMAFDTGSFYTYIGCYTQSEVDQMNAALPLFIPSHSTSFDLIPCSHEQCECDNSGTCLHTCSKLGTDFTADKSALDPQFTFDPHTAMNQASGTYMTTIKKYMSNMKKTNENYNYPRSLNEDEDTCFANIIYLDGRIAQGPFFTEKVSLSDFSNPTSSFQYEMLLCDHSPNPSYNGILGAAKYAPQLDYMVIDFYSALTSMSDFIGICSSNENEGGIITLGGYNSNYIIDESSLSWLPLSTSPYFMFRVIKMSMGMISTSGNWQFIYDSGFTRSIFPTAVSDSLKGHVLDVSAQHGLEVEIQTDSDIIIYMSEPSDYFEKLTFYDYDERMILEVQPKHLFRKIVDDKWLINWSSLTGDDFIILGSLMTRELYVLLDEDKQSIAFAPAHCPTHTIEDRVLSQQSIIPELKSSLPSEFDTRIYLWIFIGVALGSLIALLVLSISVRFYKDNRKPKKSNR